jgi:hypothetical protein
MTQRLTFDMSGGALQDDGGVDERYLIDGRRLT